MKIALYPLLVGVCFLFSLPTSQAQIAIEIQAGEHDRIGTPVKVILDAKEALGASRAKINFNGKEIDGQLCELGLVSLRELGDRADAASQRELHFILPRLPAGQRFKGTVTFGLPDKADKPSFRFEDEEGYSTDLILGDRPVMRYMYEKLDTSSQERIGETYKVYHHVYDPLGKGFVTKGPGGLFPHHRGLFYGFNKKRFYSLHSLLKFYDLLWSLNI